MHLRDIMNQILKQIATLLTIIVVFVTYVLMQNYAPNNKQSIGVAIIKQNEKFLLTQNITPDNQQSKWGFVAGKVMSGENLNDCLKRTLKAQLNITAQIGSYIGTSSFYVNNQELELHAFMIDSYTGKIELSDKHANFAWVTTKDLANYDLQESQLPFIKMLF